MGSVRRDTIANLVPGTYLLESNGRTWVRVGWESVGHRPGSLPPFILESMGLVPVCDLGGNVHFASDSLVVTAIEPDPVEGLALSGWQCAVN